MYSICNLHKLWCLFIIFFLAPPSSPNPPSVHLLNTTALSLFKIPSLINTPSVSDYPVTYTTSMSSYTTNKEPCITQTVSSPTSLISAPSIIPTPNTDGNNGDVFAYIYGLSVGIVLLIIIIIIVIISVIYIIKYLTRSESNI